MAHETAPIDVVVGELLPLLVNISLALDAGDTVDIVTATVVEAVTGAAIAAAIAGTPTVTGGSTLHVALDASKLEARNTYFIRAVLTIEAGVKIVTVLIPVTCNH